MLVSEVNVAIGVLNALLVYSIDTDAFGAQWSGLIECNKKTEAAKSVFKDVWR